MKNIELIIPKLEEYSYEQKLESEPKTMSYNAGYKVMYNGYHYDTGCIVVPKEKWQEVQNSRIKENRYFAYYPRLPDTETPSYPPDAPKSRCLWIHDNPEVREALYILL